MISGDLWADRQRRTFPPVLYAPAGPKTLGGDHQVELEITRDQRIALVLYTALDRLIDGCGDEQPWVLIRAEDLDGMCEVNGVDVIYLDLVRPAHRRRPPGEEFAQGAGKDDRSMGCTPGDAKPGGH